MGSEAKSSHRYKIGYRTVEAAGAAAESMNQKRPIAYGVFGAYQCLYCTRFHIGHSYGGRLFAKPSTQVDRKEYVMTNQNQDPEESAVAEAPEPERELALTAADAEIEALVQTLKDASPPVRAKFFRYVQAGTQSVR